MTEHRSSAKRWLWLALRVLILAGAIAFVLSQVDLFDRTVTDDAGRAHVEPGLITRLAGADLRWIALAFASFSCFTITGIIRWWLLLRVQGFRFSLWYASRLSLIGLFFNNVIPGLTGGDVVKAVAVARGAPKQEARAVTTVVLDRLLGLVAVLTLGAVVALLHLATPVYRDAAVLLLVVLGAGAIGAAFVFVRTLRRVLRIDRLMRRLPFQSTLREVDDAVRLYRAYPAKVVAIFGFSVFGQIFGVLDAWCMARAIGTDVPLTALLVVIPVIQVASLIPVSPGGWGVGEGLYAYFFKFVGVPPATSVLLSVGTRSIYTIHCLLGGLFLLAPGDDARRAHANVGGAG